MSAKGTPVRPVSTKLRGLRTGPRQLTQKGEVKTTKAGTKPDMGGYQTWLSVKVIVIMA